VCFRISAGVIVTFLSSSLFPAARSFLLLDASSGEQKTVNSNTTVGQHSSLAQHFSTIIFSLVGFCLAVLPNQLHQNGRVII